MRAESSSKSTSSGETRKFGNYCFTLSGVRHTFPRPFPKRPGLLFFPRKSKILPTSPGREDARQGEKREISKCSGIIKVYRFTVGRLSYANLAGGHPLGLFLQISPVNVCPREMANRLGKRECECALSFTTRLLYQVNGKFNIRYTIAQFPIQYCAINYGAHFVTSSFPSIFIRVENQQQ